MGKITSLVLRTHLGPFSHEGTGTINCYGKVNVVAPEVPSQPEIGCGTDISKHISAHLRTSPSPLDRVKGNTELSSFLARGD